MKTNENLTRWDLFRVNLENECITVRDKLVKKNRTFHVPFLIHAEIIEQSVYIFTSNSKIMELNLSTASRQFLSCAQLENLKKIQQKFNSLQIESNGLNPTCGVIRNNAQIPVFSFSNTLNYC